MPPFPFRSLNVINSLDPDALPKSSTHSLTSNLIGAAKAVIAKLRQKIHGKPSSLLSFSRVNPFVAPPPPPPPPASAYRPFGPLHCFFSLSDSLNDGEHSIFSRGNGGAWMKARAVGTRKGKEGEERATRAIAVATVADCDRSTKTGAESARETDRPDR